MSTVLLVGNRRSALEAAASLGLEVVLVAERKPASALADRWLECPFAEDTDWRAIAAVASEGRQIAAVVALTERAVVPAAELRRHLGLEGDSPEAARRVTDKAEMKRAIAAAGLACAPFVELSGEVDGEQLVAELGLPLVLKARVGSGGRENLIIHHRRELPARVPDGWMAEAFVAGTEMSFEALVQDGQPVFTNPTEYFKVRWASIAPAALPKATLGALRRLNTRALQALGVRQGMTHLELFLTDRGPVFSELAARPPGGHLTEIIELAWGFDPWQALLRIALGERPRLPRSPRQVAGAWLLHPGPGVLRRVTGSEAVRGLAGVERLQLRAKPGSRLGVRQGSGQEVGHLLVSGPDRDTVAARLRRAFDLLTLEIEPLAGA